MAKCLENASECIELQRADDGAEPKRARYNSALIDANALKSGKRLHDGTHIVYVNGATRSRSEIGKLIHDLLCRDAAKMHFDIFKNRVGQFKNLEEGRLYMCEAMERFISEGKAEGRAEGEARGKRKGKRETMLATAKRLLANGKLMLKEIAECSGLSLAQVKKLQASMA